MSSLAWVAVTAVFTILTAVAPAWAPVGDVQVPEPGTLALFAAGFAGLMALRAFRRRRDPS